MKVAIWLPIVTGLYLAPGSVAGQPLHSDERVRVTILAENHSSRSIGLFSRATSDSLFVRDPAGQMQSWPLENVTLLERSLGRRGHAGSGALIGGAIGLGVGIIAGSTAHRESQFIEVDTGGAVLIAAVITGVGAGLGALVGAAARSDRWQTLPPEKLRPAAEP